MLLLRRFNVISWFMIGDGDLGEKLSMYTKTVCCGLLRPSAIGYNALKPFLLHVKFYDSTTKKKLVNDNRSIYFQHSPLFCRLQNEFSVFKASESERNTCFYFENIVQNTIEKRFSASCHLFSCPTSESTDTFFTF